MDTNKAHAFADRLGDLLETFLRESGPLPDDELAAGIAEFVLCASIVAPNLPGRLCDIIQSVHVERLAQ